MRLESGTRLGPYEVIAPIGAGGMGEVYHARDSRLNRDVAIKVLPSIYSQDPERLRRFQHEARAAGILNHPNILAIYDVGEHEGSPYIISELLQGQSLRQKLKDGALPPRKAVEFALQIAEGLAAAHDKRIIHRDLKPENLFVTKEERLKILDFGLAKLTHAEEPANITALSTETGKGIVMGTFLYMSPEQVRSQPADQRSDIFAFGSVLYEMLAGRIVFQRETPVETLNAILKEDIPEFPVDQKISPALERIVRYCLDKNPEQRFQSARDLALALQAVTGSSPVTVSVPPARVKSRLFATAGALLVLCLIATASFLAGRKMQPQATASGLMAPSFQKLTFRRGTITGARFAPDGKSIIYSASWEGRPVELFSLFSGALESRPLGISGLNVSSISSQGQMALVPRFGGVLSIAPIGGGAPREVTPEVVAADWAPDGKNLALVRMRPLRLEYPAGTVLLKGQQFIAPRVSSDGNRIAFGRWEADEFRNASIYVVDRSGKTTKLSTGWTSIGFGLAWSPNQEEIWFRGTDESGDGLYAVTLQGKLRLVWRMPGGSVRSVLDISKDGTVLIGQGSWRNSMVGFLNGDDAEREISWLDFPVPVDLSSDGKTVLFAEQGYSQGKHYSIYLRKAGESMPVRLGEGNPAGLSSDGQWVLSFDKDLQLVTIPTGAGEERRIQNSAHYQYQAAAWFPDGKQILFDAIESGHKPRIYVQGLDEARAHAITPEGISFQGLLKPISPDSNWVIARLITSDQRQYSLFPSQGGEARQISGITGDDLPIQWSADSKSLYVQTSTSLNQASIYKINLATGRRELWKTVGPTDLAGVFAPDVIVTPDGKYYVYSYFRELTDLYLVRGLK